jgi:hypothetical protein
MQEAFAGAPSRQYLQNGEQMPKPLSVLSDYQASIEDRLAEALQEVQPPTEPDTVDLSSRELLQMAWDKAEQELDALQTELRLLRQQHQAEERDLLLKINEKKRLRQALLDRAPERAARG